MNKVQVVGWLNRKTARNSILGALVGVTFGLSLGAPAYAASYATGGTGPYRNQIQWLTWGGGTNGTAGIALTNGAISSSTTSLNGQPLSTTCTLGNITPLSITKVNATDLGQKTVTSSGGLLSYKSVTWAGDRFDNLYSVSA